MSATPDNDQSLTMPFAAVSGAAFDEPWMRRVREVDDDTLAGLLRTLVSLRRMKFAVAGVAALCGALLFGALRVDNAMYALLIYTTLAGGLGMTVFAGGSLAIRRLFVKESVEHGISRSASTLILTRAERRARFLAPWINTDEKVAQLMLAVRDPDRA